MKIQVTLNDELVKRIDEFAEYTGSNRSAICAMAIGYYVKGILEPISGELIQCEKE